MRACADDARPAVLVSSPAHLKRMPDALDWPRHAPGAAGRVLVRRAAPPEAARRRAAPHPAARPSRYSASSGDRRHRLGAARRAGGPLDRAAAGIAWRLQDGFPGRCARRIWPMTTGTSARTARCPPATTASCWPAAPTASSRSRKARLADADRAACWPPRRWCARRGVVMVELDVGTRVAAAVVPGDAGQAILGTQGRAALTAALRANWPMPWTRWRCRAAGPSCRRCRATRRARPPRPCCATCSAARCRPPTGWTPDATSATAALDVTDDLAIFDGHFPDTPIVPGVAQVDWVMALAPQRPAAFRRASASARLDTLKFQAVIQPGTTVRMTLTWQPDARALGFRLTSDTGPHASGNGRTAALISKKLPGKTLGARFFHIPAII